MLGALFGGAFALVTPPLQSPDEVRHFHRAYAISQGQWLAEPSSIGAAVRLPRSFRGMQDRLGGHLKFYPSRKQDLALVRQEFDVELRRENTGLRKLPSLYPPVAYAPQATAMAIAGLWQPAPIVYMYCGRLANLAVWLALGALAIRLAPAHRWTLFSFALLPMTLFLAASLSADAVTNGLAFLWIAAVLRASRLGTGPLSTREIIGLGFLASLVGLTKQVYWPLTLLALLIPVERFENVSKRTLLYCALLGVSLLPVALWFVTLQQLDSPISWPHSAPEAQVWSILCDPLGYAEILLNTLVARFGVYVSTFIGVLGYVDTRLPEWVYWMGPLALLVVGVADGGIQSPVRHMGRGLLLLVAMATWVLTMTSAYVGWTREGDVIVGGVQGRYFIPFAPLIAIALHWPRALRWRRWVGPGATLLAVLLLSISTGRLVLRYYDL